MCGRFTQINKLKALFKLAFGVESLPFFGSQYNIAPTHACAVVHQKNPLQAVKAFWGFEGQSNKLVINARCETLTERKLFKHLLPNDRCLVLADGFYEWKEKQPYYFHLPTKEVFAFAGLWENDRFVIITREADKNMRGIHDRMPVIFTRSNWIEWLECFQMPKVVADLVSHPVSKRVNKVANNDHQCIEPCATQRDFFSDGPA